MAHMIRICYTEPMFVNANANTGMVNNAIGIHEHVHINIYSKYTYINKKCETYFYSVLRMYAWQPLMYTTIDQIHISYACLCDRDTTHTHFTYEYIPLCLPRERHGTTWRDTHEHT